MLTASYVAPQGLPAVPIPLQTCGRKDSSLRGSNLPTSFHASSQTLPALHILHQEKTELSGLRKIDFTGGEPFQGICELRRGRGNKQRQAGGTHRDRRAAERKKREHQKRLTDALEF